MNAITKVTNGKTSNVALNVIANTAGMIASAVAITTAVAVLAPAAKADTIYQDSWSHDIWDRPTYGQGQYTELDNNDFQRSNLWDSTLQDRDGNLYDCNSFGNCHSRW